MELNEQQRDNLSEMVRDGMNVSKAIFEFPDVEVSILRRYDNVSQQSETRGAFFSHKTARKAMMEVKPSGNLLEETYHICKTSVGKLVFEEVFDDLTGEKLTPDEKNEVYHFLCGLLEEEL